MRSISRRLDDDDDDDDDDAPPSKLEAFDAFKPFEWFTTSDVDTVDDKAFCDLERGAVPFLVVVIASLVTPFLWSSSMSEAIKSFPGTIIHETAVLPSFHRWRCAN